MRVAQARKASTMRKLAKWLKKPENRAILFLSALQGITSGAITCALIALKSL